MYYNATLPPKSLSAPASVLSKTTFSTGGVDCRRRERGSHSYFYLCLWHYVCRFSTKDIILKYVTKTLFLL